MARGYEQIINAAGNGFRYLKSVESTFRAKMKGTGQVVQVFHLRTKPLYSFMIGFEVKIAHKYYR